MKRILLTGAGGFVGTWLRRFSPIMHEYDVICASTTRGGQDFVRFEKEYSDVSKLGPVDVILHFASDIPASFSEATYEGCFTKNVRMMNNLVQFARACNASRFVYLSSFGSMRNPAIADIRDYYTLSKLCGERFVDMMSATGMDAASLRISAPYGEYSKGNSVIGIFTDNALRGRPLRVFGTGAREQNFTYVGDVVQAVEKCLLGKIRGVYEIVGRGNVSMLELAKTIKALAGSDSEIVVGERDDPQEGYCPRYDYRRAALELGYSPEFDMERGLDRYVSWRRECL